MCTREVEVCAGSVVYVRIFAEASAHSKTLILPSTATPLPLTQAIAQPLALQASGADGAPCVRYAGGTAPLAALQELAESFGKEAAVDSR